MKHYISISSLISVTAMVMLMFTIWGSFSSKRKVFQPELTTTNTEWIHGCPPPCHTFEEPAFVQVQG